MTSASRPIEILPLDDHNRALIENVHPPQWRNPTPADRYHLVVIGAGTAGLVTAIVAAGLGARVALVERHLMGGDCLNVGCVPSKGTISAARAWHAARGGGAAFGAPHAEGGDFALAMERMRRLRASISHLDSAARFQQAGVDVFLGHARFLSTDAVEVDDGSRLRFRRAVVATGARAAAPPIPGLAEVAYLTNESVFSLTSRPTRMVIVGAGPIGCEMAQAFARFGTEVTLVDVADQVLAREDADAARIVQQALVRDGVHLRLGVGVLRIEARGEENLVVLEHGQDREEEILADEILVAAGRKPNVEDLGLEEADVDYDKDGIVVDDRLRTTNRRIFAAGDVTPHLKFTHLADAHAAIVIQNALFFGRRKASRLVVPWCTYTSPEIAHVGLYARDAEMRGQRIEVITVGLDEVDRAILDGEDAGFLRVVLAAGSDRILGATLVAAHAGDLIGTLALTITHGIGLGRFATTIFPYPTQAEILKKAANAWRRQKLSPRVKKIFDLWFRIFR